MEDFQILGDLGKGSFGQVYMVKDEEKRINISNVEKFYAMKIIPKTKIQTED